MKRVDMAVSAVFFALSVWVLWQSTLLPKFSIFGPGPEFMPRVLAVVLIVLSSVLFVTTARKAGVSGEKLIPSREGVFRIAVIIGALFLYTYMIEIIGYAATTFAYCLGMLLILWKARWYYSVVVAAVLTGSFYWAFIMVLDVPVPTGIFGS